MIHKRLFFPLLLLVLAVPFAIQAQDGSLSSIPTGLSEDIDAYSYEFDAIAGEEYTIDLTSSEFDTFLRLLDDEGTEIATDDDSGEGLNSQIVFTPDEDGIYVIVVDSFSTDAVGDAELSIDSDFCYIQVAATDNYDTYRLASDDVLAGDDDNGFVWSNSTLIHEMSNWLIWENDEWSVGRTGYCDAISG